MYRTTVLIIAFLMSGIGVAQDDQGDGLMGERLRNLEEDIELLAEEQSAVITSIQDAIQLALYGTLEYENFEQTNSAFDARNIELIIAAQLNGRLRAGAEIEFERTAQTSGSSNRTGEVEVEQGWIEYVVTEAARFRFGVVLVPFGKYNLQHFDTTRDLTDRPIMMRRVIPVTWAEAGAGVTGQITLRKDSSGEHGWALHYSAYLVNGLTNDLNDTSIRNARGGFGSDNNNNKALVGRVGLVPSSDLEIGLSGYRGKLDSDSEDSILGLAADVEYQRGRFEFLGEFAQFDLDGGFEADGITARPEAYSGYYLQGNYQFWPSWLNDTFMDRSFRNPTLTASARYGAVKIDDDGDVGASDNEEERFTIGLNYRPTETFVFKIEYQFNQTENESVERGDRNGFVFSASAAF